MTPFLGLLGMAMFIALIIGFAAAVTWTVVRLSPVKPPGSKPPTTEP
jgi:hypothetical protein